jgi:hypothetical protein
MPLEQAVMGTVVDLDSRRPVPNPGNGAREAFAAAWEQSFESVDGPAFTMAHVDLMLAWLWYYGFKIVPAK